MPPLKPGPWTDVRDTSQFGHGCMQNVLYSLRCATTC